LFSGNKSETDVVTFELVNNQMSYDNRKDFLTFFDLVVANDNQSFTLVIAKVLDLEYFREEVWFYV